MRSLVFSAVVAAALLVPTTSAHADPQTARTYVIHRVDESTGTAFPNYCVAVDHPLGPDDWGVDTYPTCTIDGNHLWSLWDMGDGTVRFQNTGSGRFMQAHVNNNDVVTAEPDVDTTSQHWTIVGVGDGTLTIVSASTGKCFTQAKTHDVLYTCGGTYGQRWVMQLVG